MNQSTIDEAIYNKYIAPTKLKKERYVGIEIEMPIVNLDKQPVDIEKVFDMSRNFQTEFSFDVCSEDDDHHANAMESPFTNDNLSFDCSYSNLELSMGKGKNIHELKERFDSYYTFINHYFEKYHYTLTGMGINPYYNINENKPVPNERYRMLYHHLHTYKKYKNERRIFHDYPEFGTYTSASQIQTDIFYHELIDVLNAFTKLEPYKVLLFANSLHPDEAEYLCSRNMLWEYSMQGYNPHNIGMFEEELGSIEELLEYIKSTSIYCVMRDGKYINFKPTVIDDYLKRDKMEGEFFDGNGYRRTEFVPDIADLAYLRSFKFEDLTFRGTIEFRSMCCQPIQDSMSIAAFHMGLIDNVGELAQILNEDSVLYTHGYNATELQKMMSKVELPEFVNREKLKGQLLRLIDLADRGLKKRGYGEEKYLLPLYDRAEKLSNPARDMHDGLMKGRSVEDFIKIYS